jgi:hypothetical protein
MLSLGLWWWYINITITILDIIHRLIFYFDLNSTQLNSTQLYSTLLYGFVRYLIGNRVCLRYEPNRLMLCIGLWRWCIKITITILDIIYCPLLFKTPSSFFNLNTTLLGLYSVPSSGQTYSVGPYRWSYSSLETDGDRVQHPKRCVLNKNIARRIMLINTIVVVPSSWNCSISLLHTP